MDKDFKKVSPSRMAALELLNAVVVRKQTLDHAITNSKSFNELLSSDRKFARLIASTAVRRLGQTDAVLGCFLKKALPARTEPVLNMLRLASTEILFLGVDAYAAVDSAVTIVKAGKYNKFGGLTNAVLRRVAKEGKGLIRNFSEELNFPDWIVKSWMGAYGRSKANRLFVSSLEEPTLDISVKKNIEVWAKRLKAQILLTGSLRRKFDGRIEKLPGFEEGEWWVQDAGAAIPVMLFGDLKGIRVLDACAAPGGKTAQLVAAGAKVTAIDRSASRLKILENNLVRLGLSSRLVNADVVKWDSQEVFDAVLLDAPCTATGTIRRNPDILISKTFNDMERVSRLQAKLLDIVSKRVKQNGQLVFCTCSLQPEEGEERIADFLARNLDFRRKPIQPSEIGGLKECIDENGDLRILPTYLAEEGGFDGFFVARISRV